MSGEAREPIDLETWDYSGATMVCDVVMKGGITSGVVYPHGICELATTYKFKNVGGTSAGAIAAAATAAAEYGRAAGGFQKLATLPKWIGAPGNLSGLFQADASTKGLFSVLMAKIEHGFWVAAAVAAIRHPISLVIGALPGVLLMALAGQGSGALEPVAWVIGALLALVGAALGVTLRLIVKLLRRVPGNDYGLCSGWGDEPDPGNPPLTGWLYGKLNEYAGLSGEPLTFGHLWAGPDGQRNEPPAEDKRQIQLAMMTTNLTNRRAHQLPWESDEWFFCVEEFTKLFPPEAVKWMEEKAQGPEMMVDGHTLRPLPAPADMPVIVATRLSLSFPVLLSAVPLWRKGGASSKVAPEPERCWFSDGGISSNFPVHFFDRLLPRWPTFAINLRQFRADSDEKPKDQAANTWMVESEQEEIEDWWYRLPSRSFWPWRDHRLFEFVAGIVRTMQNRIDEAQMRVPGYRDRVAHVYLRKKQGGMNLTMDEETIKALTDRGRWAADRLRTAYTSAPGSGGVTWDGHRWVRLRSSLAVLERMHGRFADNYEDIEPPPGDYPWTDEEQQDLAATQVKAVRDVAKANADSGQSVEVGAPQPSPEGRIEPRG